MEFSYKWIVSRLYNRMQNMKIEEVVERMKEIVTYANQNHCIKLILTKAGRMI